MAQRPQSQRSYDRTRRDYIAAAIEASGGTPRLLQIEHHAQVYNGLPLLDPVAFGAVMAGWGGAVMFGVARLAEQQAGAAGSGLPGSIAIMAGGAVALVATVWRTNLLADLARRVDVETAEFAPPADDKPAGRVFNVNRRTVFVLTPEQEAWRLKLADMAELMPARGNAFLVRDWTPSANGFSRPDWDRLRAELVTRNWLDNSTSRLTAPGRAVMTDWRDNPHGATVTDVARAMAT